MGDPAGIGPEIVKLATADPRVRSLARLVVLGPEEHLESSWHRVSSTELGRLDDERDVLAIATEASSEIAVGQVTKAAGEAALAALKVGAELASS